MGWRDVLAAPFRGIGSAIQSFEDRSWGTPDAKPVGVTPPGFSSSPYQPSGQFANAFSGSLAASQARNAPISSILNNQYGLMTRNTNLTGQQFDNTAAGLNANYGFDVRSLGLKQAGMALEKGSTERLGGLLGSRLDMANQMRQFLDPEFAMRDAEARRGTAYEAFKNKAETRGRGAMGSEGFRADQTDIKSRGDFTSEELYRQYQRDVLRANDDIRGAGEAVAQNKDNVRQLDIQAQQLGVDRERLASNLQLGLQRLGLDRQISVNELLQRMGSNRVDYQMLGQRIFQEALQAAPIFQSASYLPPAMQAALGGGR